MQDYETISDDAIEEMDTFEPFKAPEPKLSFAQKFIYVFTNPKALFEEIDLFPKILVPMLIIALIGSFSIYINMGELIELQRQTLVDTYMSQGMEIPADGMMAAARILGWITLATAGLMFVIIGIVKALFTRGFASIFGGEGSYKRILSVVLHSYFIIVIGSVVEALIARFTGMTQFSLSPALFLGSTDTMSPFYILMASFNLFTLWYLGVTIIGVRTIEKINWGAAAFCALFPFLVFTFGQYFLSMGIL